MAIFDFLSGDFVEPVECVIKVDRQDIGEILMHLSEVTVNMSRREFSEAILKFESPADEFGTRIVADRPELKPWSDITVDVVFGSGPVTLFSGVIYDVSSSFPQSSGAATLTLTCRDRAAKLSRFTRLQDWGDETTPSADSIILADIIQRHNLMPHPANGSGMTGLIIRRTETDICFLRLRAADNGYDLIFFDDLLYFGPPMVDGTCQPTIMVYAGQQSNCYSFDITNNGENVTALAFADRDDDGNPVADTVVRPDLPLMGSEPAYNTGNGLDEHQAYMSSNSSVDAETQRRRAQARVNEQSLSVKANGELDGSVYRNVLIAGQPVMIDGVGEAYSGMYLVDSVTHTINQLGYRQNFELLRNAVGYEAGASSIGAAIAGGL